MSQTAGPAHGVPVVPLENELMEELAMRGWRVAAAESLTGGQVVSRLCASPGGGDRVLGGIVIRHRSQVAER